MLLVLQPEAILPLTQPERLALAVAMSSLSLVPVMSGSGWRGHSLVVSGSSTATVTGSATVTASGIPEARA